MNILGSSDFSSWPIVLLVIAALVGIHWFAVGSHKSLIATEVAKLRARLISVTWSPRLFFGDKNDTFYDVVMELPSGKRVSVVCKCNMMHGVYWESTPWAAELMREPVPPATDSFETDSAHLQIICDCPRCGYGIKRGWVACPNCGTDVSTQS